MTPVDALSLDSTVNGDQPATLQQPILLLTPEQAARALAISRTGLYQLLRSGQLRSVKIGACRRVPRDALDRYVARLSVAALDAGEVGKQ